eukprot:3939297-Rhodomonas_salina.1
MGQGSGTACCATRAPRPHSPRPAKRTTLAAQYCFARPVLRALLLHLYRLVLRLPRTCPSSLGHRVPADVALHPVPALLLLQLRPVHVLPTRVHPSRQPCALSAARCALSAVCVWYPSANAAHHCHIAHAAHGCHSTRLPQHVQNTVSSRACTRLLALHACTRLHTAARVGCTRECEHVPCTGGCRRACPGSRPAG